MEEGGDPVPPHFKDIYLQIRKDGKLIHDSFPSGNSPQESDQYLFRESSRESHGSVFELKGCYDLSGVNSHLSVLRRTLIVGCLLSFLLMLPMSLFLSRVLLQPFSSLANQTSKLSAEQLSFRFPEPQVLDEYGILTRNFNELINRLERSFRQVKGFALNASHELRTPLAVIISQGEMALRRERSPEDYRTALEKIVTPAKNLREITNRLLVLAELHRLEGDGGPVRIDGGETIREAVETLRNAYPDRRELTIDYDDLAGPFYGRKEIFRIVLANLLENALKHAESKVTVTVQRENANVVLLVEDDGPGMSTETSVAPTKKGTGIGLSIVRACLDSIGGTLDSSRSNLGGVRAQVLFPFVSQA